MEELFGVPMNSIMIVLLVLLAVCLLSVAFIAWRRPVIFKLGVRNIPRRKAQTSLIIIGLMLATLIISAALGTGDTLNNSVRSVAVDSLGPLDEMIVSAAVGDEEPSIGSVFSQTLPEQTVESVRAGTQGNPDIDGIGGVLFSQAPVLNIGSTSDSAATMDELIPIAEGSNPAVRFAGLRQDTINQIGGIDDVDGNSIDVGTLGAEGVYVNDRAVEELQVGTGDRIAFSIGNTVHYGTVQGILPESVLTGAVAAGDPAVLVELGRLQEMTGQPGMISAVAISNRGGTEAGLDLTDQVVDTLEPLVEGQPLGIVPIKQFSVEQAELIGNVFVTFFIIFGLFSIGVGILLIILIFTMLAAERRSEMGMERAVGAQRRQLIQQFMAEGAGYTLISGLVGTALGVAAAWAIAQSFKGFIGDAFDISVYFSARSLIIAYCLGVVITFLAVAISSWRVSRLNIVAAVRDIPDAYDAKRNKRQLVWSIVMIAAGAALVVLGEQTDLLAFFSIGMTLIPFGIAGILTYLGLSSRWVLTAAGIYTLVYWFLPEGIFQNLFGDDLSGDIDMFFVSGICIVAASTLVIVQNLDSILSIAERLGGRLRGAIPAMRLAVSYPGANKGRTGLTIAMFSLIVFSLVMVSAINENFSRAFLSEDSNAGWEVVVTVPKENTVTDFNAALAADGVDTGQIAGVGRLDYPNEGANKALDKGGEWLDIPISAADAGYLDNPDLRFQGHATGYDTDEAIITALKTEPDVMVIDSFSAENAEAGFGPQTTKFAGVPMEGTFAPAPAELRVGDEAPKTMRVIGVIDAAHSMLFGVYLGPPATAQLFPANDPRPVSYYLNTAEGVDPGEVANEVELALLPYGATGIDLEQQMEDDQATQRSFMYVLQGFMGLGLIVGIAAVGVIAFRAVVERRQQIGMLRALGFQSGTVSQAFVIESAIIVILGVVAGSVFGLILAYQLMTSEDFTEGAPDAGGFVIPWTIMIVTLTTAIVSALLMAWLPARQASRVVPAEALRYE